MQEVIMHHKLSPEELALAKSRGWYWHEIVEANKDDEVWRKKSCTIGGNQCSNVARITRHGNQVNGWVGKDGFNQHT